MLGGAESVEKKKAFNYKSCHKHLNLSAEIIQYLNMFLISLFFSVISFHVVSVAKFLLALSFLIFLGLYHMFSIPLSST